MHLTEAERDEIFAKDDGHCHWCGVELERDGEWDADHDVTVKAGGSNDLENLWPSCMSCNRSRQARTSEDFEGDWENDSVVGEMYKLTPVGHRGAGLRRQHRRDD